MKDDSKYSRHTHSYLALRKTVGCIGILLPFVLMFGLFLISDKEIIQMSISDYYYTEMRDVFVGALCAISLFMFFYTGLDKWDNRMGNAAGIFALGVAWFPTTEMGMSNSWINNIHFTSAGLLFSIFIIFSLFLFTKKGLLITPQKLKRNMVYIICGIVMIVCLVFIAIYNLVQDDVSKFNLIFWAETILLIAFGLSWLTKGEFIYPDK